MRDSAFKILKSISNAPEKPKEDPKKKEEEKKKKEEEKKKKEEEEKKMKEEQEKEEEELNEDEKRERNSELEDIRLKMRIKKLSYRSVNQCSHMSSHTHRNLVSCKKQ